MEERDTAHLTPEERSAFGRMGYDARLDRLSSKEHAANRRKAASTIGKIGADAYLAKTAPEQRSEQRISMWQETHCFLLEIPIPAKCKNKDCVRPKENAPYLHRCYESRVGLIYISRRCHESCTGDLVPIDRKCKSQRLDHLREKIEIGTVTPFGEEPPPIRGKRGDERIHDVLKKIEESQGPDHFKVARATAAVFFDGNDCPSCKIDKKGNKSPTGMSGCRPSDLPQPDNQCQQGMGPSA